MSCSHCAATIKKVLGNISGIESVEVSLTDKLNKVGGKFENNTFIKNIQSAGFSIEEKRIIK